MMVARKRRIELEEIVTAFCMQNNLKLSEDIFQELRKIGFAVYGVKFKKSLSGMILVDEREDKIPKFISNKVILYDIQNDVYDVRFIVLHELAHYIYDKHEKKEQKLILAMRDHTVGYSSNIDEQEKDYMAAAMLLPMNDFKTEIVNYEKKPFEELVLSDIERLINDDYFIQLIQRKYKVKDILVKRRIEEVFDRAA